MERRFEVRMKQLMNECKVNSRAFEGACERLEEFAQPFASTLETETRERHCHIYLRGLISGLERKNTESIAYFFDQDRMPLQRFIGCVEWDHRPMLMELTRQVGGKLGKPDGVIVFDPSPHAKQGEHSVGVQRQWNGNKGKVDNCQVGVYMGYVSGEEHALVDVRLYLSKKWCRDRKRRRKCGVPEDVEFATRMRSSLEMLEEKGHLLPHAWIAGDDEMGRSTQFRRDLRALNKQYLLAVPSNTLVRDLQCDPPQYSGRGKRPMAPFVRVDRWRERLAEKAWTPISIRDGEKGPMVVDVVMRRVLAITERKHPEKEETLVIIRRRDETGTIVHDYCLSNASYDTPAKEFARVANAQHRIEECIKRAKSQTGLSDYETRTWWGWYHHQTLSLLASWFLLTETMRGKKIDTGANSSAGSPRIGSDHLSSSWPARRGSHCTQLSATTRTKRTSTLISLQTT